MCRHDDDVSVRHNGGDGDQSAQPRDEDAAGPGMAASRHLTVAVEASQCHSRH